MFVPGKTWAKEEHLTFVRAPLHRLVVAPHFFGQEGSRDSHLRGVGVQLGEGHVEVSC